MSDHSTLLASRVKTPELNKWCYDFAASKKYAVENRVPFIAIWTEGDGCEYCRILASCLVQSHFKTWMGSSGCIFWLGAAEDKWADNKEGQQSAGFMWASRALDVRTYPFVRVYWEPGKIDRAYTGNDVDGGLTGADGGTKLLVSKLTSVLKDYDPNAVPASPADDIRLLSGKNSCTAQTDPDIVDNKDNAALSKAWLANNLYSKYNCQSGPDGYSFSGWSSHSSSGSFGKELGPAFGFKTALADIKKLSEANGRPLFVMYGKANNKGSCYFNVGLGVWVRTSKLKTFSQCQAGAFDPTLSTGEFGFYFVYYFNDKNETCPEANEAKKFITQFGDIKTGYPWYCAYCKYPDKHVYARYGSLPSRNVLVGNQNAQYEAGDVVYASVGELLRKIGREIQYTWTGGQGSAPRGDGVFANRKTGVKENFVTGQWYEFGSGGGLQKFIDYAYATNLPVIAVGSTEKRRCRKFETDVLDRPELAAWLAEQDCLLLYCRSEDGKWDSGDAKLFADTFGAGDVPMVRVWCNGKTYMNETF